MIRLFLLTVLLFGATAANTAELYQVSIPIEFDYPLQSGAHLHFSAIPDDGLLFCGPERRGVTQMDCENAVYQVTRIDPKEEK